jgi:nucleoside-diphosphate-sugar epimerase
MLIIFGVTGFIGKALQSLLAEQRVPVVGFGRAVCLQSDGGSVSILAMETAGERAALLRSLPRPGAIIFVAGAAVAGTKREALLASHVGALRETIEVIPAAWWTDLPFIYASSGSVYAKPWPPRALRESDATAPHSDYAEVKLRCETLVNELIASAGARTVVARLFNVGGFGQRAGIIAEIAGQAIEIQAGLRAGFQLRTNEFVIDLVEVGEAAAALLSLARAPAPPSIVNVCSGQGATAEALVGAARCAMGRDVPVTYAVDTERRQVLVGDPALIAATTGWRAHRGPKDIVAAAMESMEMSGAAA